MNVLYQFLTFLVVLGIIVLVHEFGHYIAARLMKIRVEVFSFGFGKRLFGKKIGDTDFRVSLFPVGGYVRMAGEEDFDPQHSDLRRVHGQEPGAEDIHPGHGPGHEPGAGPAC